MKITREEVEYVARLARLKLADAEVERMTEQLDKILSYVAKLDELDTGNIETTITSSAKNVFREDKVNESLNRKDSLMNCSEQNGETFVVPRIIG